MTRTILGNHPPANFAGGVFPERFRVRICRRNAQALRGAVNTFGKLMIFHSFFRYENARLGPILVMTATLPLALEWESDMNHETEDRLEANGLVLRVLGQIDSHAITDARGRDAGIRLVLYAAADILVEAARSQQAVPAGDDLLRESLARAEWTPKKWGRATKAARALVEDAIGMMSAICQPSPDGPDGARAEAPEPADADDDLPPQEEIDKAVGSVLRQYRYNAGTLGPAAADSWAEADIAREASRIAPPLPDSRHPDWQRVHDAIRRKFNRFVMHVPDDEKLPDGNYQVWIKGWDCWVPARIEREGRTWKLPIGRVNGVGIERTVAAVRPLAA